MKKTATNIVFTTSACLLLVSFMPMSAHFIDGYVLNEPEGGPVPGARVYIKGSDAYAESNDTGYFIFNNEVINKVNNIQAQPLPIVENEIVSMDMDEGTKIRLFDIHGKLIYGVNNGEFQYNMHNHQSGTFILLIQSRENTFKIKFTKNAGQILINSKQVVPDNAYALVIEKEGYHTSEVVAMLDKSHNIFIAPIEVEYNKDYTHVVENFSAYKTLAGNPLNTTFSMVSSLKFVYEIQSGEIYFTNTKKFKAHYFFCRDILQYEKGLYFFNDEEYRYNPLRKYFLGSIDYFASSGKYMLQFFASDDINCDDIYKVFQKILSNAYFGDDLFLMPNSIEKETCAQVPVIPLDELFSAQNYQCLNPALTYGYLKKIPIEIIEDVYIGKHDIVLINGIPIDLPVVAGIITTEFQPVLSHINVLSHNRGTPNMALRDGWSNAELSGYTGELVKLTVGYDDYTIEKAGIEDAVSFWDYKENREPIILSPDYSVKALLNISEIDISDVDFCGGKAANFGELSGIYTLLGYINLPEGAFAVPFYFYRQHIVNNKLDSFINAMLIDPDFIENAQERKEGLKNLRDLIENAPLDTGFYNSIISKLENNDFNDFRFRSSTNAEDIKGFNGAGLYESKTGALNNPDKPVDMAIKKVWASLWNFSAFEERGYFKIDQKSVAMGILVHESFPDELANGVVVTKNLYNDNLTGLTINSQFGEISVVNPEEGYLPEQVLYYDFGDAVDYINISNVPGMGSAKVLTREELDILATYCRAIQGHYRALNIYQPLDIEFKIVLNELNERTVIIKQCRIYSN